jgi:hypothetical protein
MPFATVGSNDKGTGGGISDIKIFNSIVDQDQKSLCGLLFNKN